MNINTKPCLTGIWRHPVLITPNNFQYKSLSNWACNLAVGCKHGCGFCYVPSTSVNKLGPMLKPMGVDNPDAQWGQYLFIREWDEREFIRSLGKAERTQLGKLKPDGHRAVMFCSTTDAYQVVRHADPIQQKSLMEHFRFITRRALTLIRDKSSVNVRVLTRSPLARQDFDLFQSFGKRLTFGMSIPTLRNDLARVYEPNSPAPSQRLETLLAARAAGLHVFVAMAPTYPECDEADLLATLKAVAEVRPVTIFHEPINIRAENVARLAARGKELGMELQTHVFRSPQAWQEYAVTALKTVERIAGTLGISDRLHLWPDKSLGDKIMLDQFQDPTPYQQWLHRCWHRISEWP